MPQWPRNHFIIVVACIISTYFLLYLYLLISYGKEELVDVTNAYLHTIKVVCSHEMLLNKNLLNECPVNKRTLFSTFVLLRYVR